MLVLVLGFMTLIGVVAAVLVNYSTTGLRSTINVQNLRAREYAADGAVEVAINKVRRTASSSNASGCVVATVNSLAMRVDCADSAGTGVDVTFTSCPDTGVACTAASQTLVAKVKYHRSVSPAGMTVTSWSAYR